MPSPYDELSRLTREIPEDSFGIAVINLPPDLTDEQKAAVEFIAHAAGEAIKALFAKTAAPDRRRAN